MSPREEISAKSEKHEIEKRNGLWWRRLAAFSVNAVVLAIPVCALILANAPGRNVNAQDAAAKADEQKVKKVFYTPKDRLAAMHDAALFVPRAVGDADILEGPAQNKKQFQLHFNDKVICDFDTPGVKMGGKTEKFSCKITSVVSSDGKVQTVTPDIDEEPVKVKFGANDNEVYAEIVATRLMWAMGYYADAWFPVKVIFPT